MDVLEFNAKETPEHCIARLIKEQNADMAIAFDCADPRVNFKVVGFFVVPDGAAFKLVANHSA